MTDASPERTLALARAASGAVRDLNHAGIDSGGLDWPADAYDPAEAVTDAVLLLDAARASAAALAGDLHDAQRQLGTVHGTGPGREPRDEQDEEGDLRS